MFYSRLFLELFSNNAKMLKCFSRFSSWFHISLRIHILFPPLIQRRKVFNL